MGKRLNFGFHYSAWKECPPRGNRLAIYLAKKRRWLGKVLGTVTRDSDWERNQFKVGRAKI